ncbi:uncharacterized protein [Diadema antillarum]|uniref:uncharacterized protein n=1 Tax=Diadema antillarum TaxID=105358 RepID=UPI003A8BA47E
MEVDGGKRYGAEDLLQAYPLHRACRDGDLSALSSLLGDSVVSVCDAVGQDPLFGWTPAHWASHNGKVDCLQMLLSAGVSCNVATQEKGLTLAHVAALEGQASCLAWLCQNRVAVDARDDMGESAVHKAVRCGSVQCLHILRQHGADLSLQNWQGETAADLAMSHLQGPCLEYFRAGGDALHVRTAMHLDAGASNGAAGNRKRLQAAEMETNGEAAKRARVEHEMAETPPQSATPSNDHGDGQDDTLPGIEEEDEHEEQAAARMDESECHIVTAEKSDGLPPVAVLPRRIPREEHWRFQPFFGIGTTDVATHLQNSQWETTATLSHTASGRGTNSLDGRDKNGRNWFVHAPYANGTVMMDSISSSDQPVMCGSAYSDASVTTIGRDDDGGSGATFHVSNNSNHASDMHVSTPSNGVSHVESMSVEVDDAREAPMACRVAHSVAMTTHLFPNGDAMGLTKQSPMQKTQGATDHNNYACEMLSSFLYNVSFNTEQVQAPLSYFARESHNPALTAGKGTIRVGHKRTASGGVVGLNGSTNGKHIGTKGTTMESRCGNGSVEVTRDYVPGLPGCQPVFQKTPFLLKGQEFREMQCSNHGDDAEMAPMDDVPAVDYPHLPQNGFAVTNGNMQRVMENANIYSGTVDQSMALCTAIGSASPQKLRSTGDLMSNGAAEHREMVNHCLGYDTQVAETINSYEEVLYGHAY